MSYVKFLRILEQCGKEIDWQTESKWLKGIYQHYIPDGSTDNFTSVDMLLTELKDKKVIRIDDLSVLREILTVKKKWSLLQILSEFEDKRKDYRELLEQISRALQESNELQRSISTCVENNLIPRESGENIESVKALFTTLEDQHKLGILNLTILKTIATKVEKPDLCRLVEEFEKRREQEEDAERWNDTLQGVRAGASSTLYSGIKIAIGLGVGAAVVYYGAKLGEKLIGVVTTHCTFHNLVNGYMAVTTEVVLAKSRSMEEFANAMEKGVLPLGIFLRAISKGSIRFTLQAENISALEALWQSYQDETLQTNMQKFLVTEEIKQLAGGEVTLTVHIDEEEYRNAMWDFIRSETEEMRCGEQRGLKDRASSESDLSRMQGLVSEDGKDFAQVKKFMSFERKIRVEEFLANLQETCSTITQTSDSGVGTRSSASTECGSGEDTEESRKEKLDHIEELITDSIENLDSALSELSITTQSEVVLKVSVEQAKQELENSRRMIHNLSKSGNEIPVEDNQMALVFAKVKEYLFSPKVSAEGVIQKIKTTLQRDQDMFENPDAEDKKLIRLVAGTSKHLNRIDVFDHLREITPPGTTGPLLPDELLFADIPLQLQRRITISLLGAGEWITIAKRLGLTPEEIRFIDKRNLNPAEMVLSYVSNQRIMSVGLVYDLLNESMLPMLADLL